MSQAKLAQKRFKKKQKRKNKTYSPKQYFTVQDGKLVDNSLPEQTPLIADTETITF